MGLLKAFAANGLLRIYENQSKPVRQLWAAFRAWDSAKKTEDWALMLELIDTGLGDWTSLDVAYLLDAQLSEQELQDYLDQYGDMNDVLTDYPHIRTAPQLVRYALAVRHARHEEYEEAAELYSELGVKNRATRMKEAARRFAEAHNPDLAAAQHLQALYDYADFLGRNSNGIFFNDSLWQGWQTSVFVSNELEDRFPKPPPEQRAHFRELDRKLQDEQEEYWRAYQILNGIVEEAGPTPLGRRAANRAIVYLRRISGRFGRPEVFAADRRLTTWLETAKQP
jgi:hypothetical protein